MKETENAARRHFVRTQKFGDGLEITETIEYLMKHITTETVIYSIVCNKVIFSLLMIIG